MRSASGGFWSTQQAGRGGARHQRNHGQSAPWAGHAENEGDLLRSLGEYGAETADNKLLGIKRLLCVKTNRTNTFVSIDTIVQ